MPSRSRARFALAACLAAAAACGPEPLGPVTELPRPLSQLEARLVDAGNRFAFAMLSEAVFTSPADLFIGLIRNPATTD